MIFQNSYGFVADSRLITAQEKARQRLRQEPYPKLVARLEALPLLDPVPWRVEGPFVSIGPELEPGNPVREAAVAAAKALIPWKKGPFRLFGEEIDAEWRSDLKWERLAPHLPDLCGSSLLDVGCNNGYYLYRLLERGARQVLGIDPTIRFALQFQLINHFTRQAGLFFEPWGWEEVASMPAQFDCILNMGILYHHQDPMGMLETMRQALKPGGTLLLETITIPGGSELCLFPSERYAQMKNVWFIPTVEAAANMLRRAKFKAVEILDETRLSPDEQRSTAWNPGPSLSSFLEKGVEGKTVEGYPAPNRAILRAIRPGGYPPKGTG